MKVECSISESRFTATLRDGIDLSIPIKDDGSSVNAYYIDHPQFKVFKAGGFVGSVEQGGACNCETLTFNPHGNATHTECYGHVSKERVTINQCLTQFHFAAQVITVMPSESDGDKVVLPEHLKGIEQGVEGLIIRTLPNSDSKRSTQHSGTNPTYLKPETATKLRSLGIEHVVLDVPSIDREDDGGLLLAHKAFWNFPEATRQHATITELAYIPNHVEDGLYLMNIQIASFESDASPSKIVLFPLTKV